MAGELITTNYGWVKPTVGASVDAWGGYINTDLDAIDSTVKSVSNFANAALNDNRIINGNFAVNQRGQVSGTAITAAAYGHDRWKAGAAGCTYTFAAALPDTMITITTGTLTQVIEAGVIEGGVYTLSWTGTAQARVYQGTPTGSYAVSPVVTASLTAGTSTIVEFNLGTLVRVKFENGSVATPYNRHSLAKSMADCQRYYSVVLCSGRFISWGAGNYFDCTVTYPTTMRATPTSLLISNGTQANVTALALTAGSNTTGRFEFSGASASTTATDTFSLLTQYSLSAEL